jgi:hypothetical protein
VTTDPWVDIWRAYRGAERGTLDPQAPGERWAPGGPALHSALKEGKLCGFGRRSVDEVCSRIPEIAWLHQEHRPAGCFEVFIERAKLERWLSSFRPKPNADLYDWATLEALWREDIKPQALGQNAAVREIASIISRRFKGQPAPSDSAIRRRLVLWTTGRKAKR